MINNILLDASIIIDLCKINLFSKALTLPYNFCSTDYIIAEICDEQQKILLETCIDIGSIKVIEANNKDIEKIALMFTITSKLSFADCSILYFSQKVAAIICTGDYRIRKEAEKNKIDVHGILWIFKKFIENKIITKTIAARKLRELMKYNTYLPVNECTRYIEEWNK